MKTEYKTKQEQEREWVNYFLFWWCLIVVFAGLFYLFGVLELLLFLKITGFFSVMLPLVCIVEGILLRGFFSPEDTEDIKTEIKQQTNRENTKSQQNETEKRENPKTTQKDDGRNIENRQYNGNHKYHISVFGFCFVFQIIKSNSNRTNSKKKPKQ